MTTYDHSITPPPYVDLYSDFLSVGGKRWPWVKGGAEEVNLLDILRTIV